MCFKGNIDKSACFFKMRRTGDVLYDSFMPPHRHDEYFDTILWKCDKNCWRNFFLNGPITLKRYTTHHKKYSAGEATSRDNLGLSN